MYFGQLAPGQLAGNLVAISQVFVRYPWADANGDKFVQANELNTNTGHHQERARSIRPTRRHSLRPARWIRT